jgi:hypothetical protein
LCCAPVIFTLEVFISMACAQCNDLCVRFPIRQPNDLRRAIDIAKQNVADGTISELNEPSPSSQVSFSALSAGENWSDVVAYKFKCNSCGELFSLHAETYHGSGGYWEPEHREAARENL